MKIIQSVNGSQWDIIQDIVKLHCPRGIKLDPTYGLGGFYLTKEDWPKYRFDINPRNPESKKGDCRDLPFANNSIQSIIFDPPNMLGMMGKHNLIKFYRESFKEFSRILKSGGILIFKCQDTWYRHKNHFTHVMIANVAESFFNFEAIDLFVLLDRQAAPWDIKKQPNAQKVHAFFWVFKKRAEK